jgi:hypothetical protein
MKHVNWYRLCRNHLFLIRQKLCNMAIPTIHMVKESRYVKLASTYYAMYTEEC